MDPMMCFIVKPECNVYVPTSRKPSRENTYESSSMCGTWKLMKTHVYHILNISIASCRPDAYETTHITHISGILLKEYIKNVSNDVFHSKARIFMATQ